MDRDRNMAEIVLSSEELVGVLQANGWVPEEVTAMEANGREIRLRVRTPLPLLKSMGVTVQFVGFEDGHVILQMSTNRFVDNFGSLIGKALESFPWADYGSRWEYPRLYVDVNRLIQQRVRGIRIADVAFRNDRFCIEMMHTGSQKTALDEPDAGEVRRACAP
jgi:hypothetical protein